MWYPELASIMDIYYTLFSFGKIWLSVGPLWTGLINAWFSLAGSKHSLTLPLDLGPNTKPLHHSVVSSIPSVWWGPFLAGVLVLPWMVPVAHRLHTWVGLGRVCYLVLAAMRMCLWNTLCHLKHCQSCVYFLHHGNAVPFVCIYIIWWMEIINWYVFIAWMAMTIGVLFIVSTHTIVFCTLTPACTYVCTSHCAIVCFLFLVNFALCCYSLYWVNIYINYIEHHSVWHPSQHLSIFWNYKECTSFHNIFELNLNCAHA